MSDAFAGEVWEDTFLAADKDKDGFLSVYELGLAMKSCGYNHTDMELQDMILDADENGDGRMDYREFVSLMTKKTARMSEITEMFKQFDTDKNGYIDFKELKAGMEKLTGNKMPDSDVEDMMEEADLDGDGRINMEEFERMMNKDYKGHDDD